MVGLHVCAPHMCLVPTKSEDGIKYPGTGIKDCEPPCGWVLGLKPTSSARVAIVLNHLALATSPVPDLQRNLKRKKDIKVTVAAVVVVTGVERGDKDHI